jgi:chemotaxis protein MotA
MKAFFVQAQKPQEVLNRLVTLAVKARKESVLALEGENFDYPFLKRAVRLVVDGVDQKSLRQILEIEIGSLKERHYLGQQVFEQMGMLAPAFGMIGTLIGLVKMLKTLSDPSSIGPAMAIALITTFYGALYANLVCIPFAKKLEQRSRDEVFNMEIIVEGVVAISQKENPNVVKEKLNSFLGPKAKIR